MAGTFTREDSYPHWNIRLALVKAAHKTFIYN
jgi:hypothetical protein